MQYFVLVFLFLLFGKINAQENTTADAENQYEHILQFHSQIQIEKTGTTTVTEKIKVYANGDQIKRGIYRTLPLWRNLNGKKQRINYDIIAVQRDGAKEKYHTKSENSDLLIYFGDKNQILSPGIYEYTLTYHTENQIGFFPNYDEFYWNVTGTLWDFQIDKVSAQVTLPEGAALLQNACYTGSYGENTSNCKVNILAQNSIEWTAENLAPHQGLTIAVGFSKGIVAPPPPPSFWDQFGASLLMVIAAISLSIYYFTTWQKHGIDPEKPVVYPQFSAPQNLSPASLGYLDKEYYSNHLISAAIVNLAVKGYIKIIEKENKILGIFGGKSYTLQKLKNADDSLAKEEAGLMQKFFSSEDSISFNGKYNPKIETAVRDFKASLAYQHNAFLSKGNHSSMLLLPALSIIIIYILGLIFSYKTTYNELLLGLGIVFGIVGIIITAVFSAVLTRSKIVPFLFVFFLMVFGIITTAVIYLDAERRANSGFYASYIFLIFSVATFVLYSYLIKKPTPEKLATQSLIQGFKMYLGTAEEKTLQFHNPPKMTPILFETLLPFAMVFGVEKIWGDKMKIMLKNSATGADSGYQSNWYIGNSMMNLNFASSLNASLSQSIASSATQPSSSGSGSGGGGFSGGGGGGGGGGGW